MKRKLAAILCFGFQFVSIAEPGIAVASEPKVIVENFGELLNVIPEYSMSSDGTVIAIVYLKQGAGNTLSAAVSQDRGNSWRFFDDFANNAKVFNFKVKVSENGKDISIIWIETQKLKSEVWMKSSKDSGSSWSGNLLIPTPDTASKNLLEFSQSNDGKTKLITYYSNPSLTSYSKTFTPEFLTAFQVSSVNSGQTWISANNNVQDIKQPYGDTFVSSDGKLLAYIYESYGNKLTQGQLRFSFSTDGINWSKESTIDSGNTFDPHSKFISLTESEITIFNDSSNALLVSKDKGKTFEKIQLPSKGFGTRFWANQEKSRFYILSLEALGGAGRVVRFSVSAELRKNWQTLQELADNVDNENSLGATRDGQIVGVLTTSWGANSDLSLQLSGDFGSSWSLPKKLNREGDIIAITAQEQEIPMYFDEKNSEVVVLANIRTPAKNSFSQQLFRIPYYKIEFDGNSNTSGSPPNTSISVDGTEVTIPSTSSDFLKKNHSFLGWGTSINNPEMVYAPGQKISDSKSNLTLYAIWKAKNPKKSVANCVKGKVIKKIKAVNPKCPAGYKKK